MKGVSVAAAAQRLDCSEPTVRRDLKAGVFEVVPGSSPTLLTEESVGREVVAKLTRMGLAEVAKDLAAAQVKIDDQERQISDLRGALNDLTAANSAMLDTFRRLSSGSVPNY